MNKRSFDLWANGTKALQEQILPREAQLWRYQLPPSLTSNVCQPFPDGDKQEDNITEAEAAKARELAVLPCRDTCQRWYANCGGHHKVQQSQKKIRKNELDMKDADGWTY